MPPARPTARSPRSGADRDERGAGVLSAWFGLVVFFTLLLFAVQVLYNLYATSVVTSVSYDAARRVAAARGDPSVVGRAEADARDALGSYANRVSFTWAVDGEAVVLRVQARNPSFLLPPAAGPLAFGDLDRTVRVRVERFR